MYTNNFIAFRLWMDTIPNSYSKLMGLMGHSSLTVKLRVLVTMKTYKMKTYKILAVLLKFYTPFLLSNVYKRVFGILCCCCCCCCCFVYNLQLLINLVSVSVQNPGLFSFGQINQDLNKIKTILNNFLQTQETCAKFQQEILKY